MFGSLTYSFQENTILVTMKMRVLIIIILTFIPCSIISKSFNENQAEPFEFKYSPAFSSPDTPSIPRSCTLHPFLVTCPQTAIDTFLASTPKPILEPAPGIADPLINTLFFLYQNFYGRVKGDSCLFYPTCSHFSQLAIAKYGFVTGFCMTAGRLARAHVNFDHSYPTVTVEEGIRYMDLPQHEDFKYYSIFTSEDFINVDTKNP